MCRQHPTDWWFAGGHRDTMMAKRICADCGVRPQCLEFALGRPELLGVWAGTTPNERATMRRAGLTATGPQDCHLGLVDLVVEAELDSAAVPEPDPEPKPETRPPADAETPPARPEPDVPRPARERVRRRGAFGDHTALLTPAEAARLLGVTPNTVTRWSRAGKVSATQTMGGHRRFRRSEIERVLRELNLPASTPS